MATVRTDFRLPAPLLERVDEARGQETRTRFLVRALEAFLDAGVPAIERLESGLHEAMVGQSAGALSSSAAKAGVVPIAR